MVDLFAARSRYSRTSRMRAPNWFSRSPHSWSFACLQRHWRPISRSPLESGFYPRKRFMLHLLVWRRLLWQSCLLPCCRWECARGSNGRPHEWCSHPCRSHTCRRIAWSLSQGCCSKPWRSHAQTLWDQHSQSYLNLGHLRTVLQWFLVNWCK